MLAITCSTCQKKLSAKEELAGKKVKCPGCSQVTTVPTQSTANGRVGNKDLRTVPPAPNPDLPTIPPTQAMRQAVLCSQCGKTLPADAPQGLCPACMMQLGVDSAGAEQRTMPPSAANPTEVATLPPQAQTAETVAPPPAGPATEPTSADSGASFVDIPGYEILGELGRGGMGVVYKARHKKLGRLIALKMILAGGHAGEADLARFRTEAEAIARVKHANIIQIYEISEHDGKPYFALEYCDGGSLAQKIDGTPMQPKDAARMVEKLARGMEAAHQEDIIHRKQLLESSVSA